MRDIITEPTECPECGSEDLGVCCAFEDREDHADIVACENCSFQAPLSIAGRVSLNLADHAVSGADETMLREFWGV
jgi:hypothetical protein